MVTGFRNRAEAGRRLALLLEYQASHSDVRVLGLPRGGVPVAFEVADHLQVPMDVFLVRKLGVPGHEELAMGAVAEGGLVYTNDNVIHTLNISQPVIQQVLRREQEELERQAREYRAGMPMIDVAGMRVILIDDGLATGASMRVAVRAIYEREPSHVMVAVPVAPPDTCAMLEREADEVVCALMPPFFTSVGSWYEDFSQTTDEEVRLLLKRAHNIVPSAR